MEHLNSTCMIHVYIMMRMKKNQGLNQARTCCLVRCLVGASRGVSGLSWVPGWFSRSLTCAVWVTQCFAAQAVTPLAASVETAAPRRCSRTLAITRHLGRLAPDLRQIVGLGRVRTRNQVRQEYKL